MATKIDISNVDKELTEEMEVGGTPQTYEPCLVKVVGMKLFKEKDENHDNKLIQKYDNVVEIKLGVQDGEFKGQVIDIYGFAKTQSGAWACYPSINGSPRPILREVLDRIREYEHQPEITERIFKFSPSELMNRSFIVNIKKGKSKEGVEFFVVETDYRKQEDAKYAEKQKEKEEENADIQRDADKVFGDQKVEADDLPF